jgi:quercetin dioxygenase-like cupin family protein
VRERLRRYDRNTVPLDAAKPRWLCSSFVRIDHQGGIEMAHEIVDANAVEAQHGVFKPLRQALGVTAFGINQLELAPAAEGPEHDHTKDGQEEVYVIVRGAGTIRVDGVEAELRPGHYVFLSPDARRQMVAGDQGLAWVGVGCQPGAFKSEQ